MSGRQLNAAQRAERTEKRAADRQARWGAVQALCDWRTERIAAAEKANAKAISKRRKDRAESRRSRGYDSPDAPTATVTPHEVGKRGTPIDSRLGVSLIPGRGPVRADYATRRAMGARGKPRKPRRRELRTVHPFVLERRRREAEAAAESEAQS